MQGALSQLRSWKLDHNQEDIRGWALRDPEGHVLGTVGDLVVDTDTKHVTQVILGDGKRYSAHDILLGENALTLAGASTLGARKVAEAAIATAEVERAKVERAKVIPRKEAPRIVAEAKSDVADFVIPVVEEDISVEKRTISTGGMHVESRIVKEPFDQEVRLREESVKVDRRRVDEPISAADAETRLHDGTVEVKATSERVVVDKRAHVVEEILLKKDSKEHVEHVRDTIRHTEVEISELTPTGSSKVKKGVKS